VVAVSLDNGAHALADLDEDELLELAEDLEYALTDGPLYPEEIEIYGDARRDVEEYLERLRSAESRSIRGGADVDTGAGERTLNMVAQDDGDTMQRAQADLICGVHIVNRWARIGARHYPRFGGGGQD
jgi:hypothetical protein